MIRRAALAVALTVFVLGLFSTEAQAARVRHHKTAITIQTVLNGSNLTITGLLDSNHGRCERNRLVGLFRSVNDSFPLAQTRSDSAGGFTLNAQATRGQTYSVIAYRQNGGCLRVCDMSVHTFTL